MTGLLILPDARTRLVAILDLTANISHEFDDTEIKT